MSGVSVRVLGSGDAFGSGGRLQTCFLVEGAGTSFLVDCGASALIAMRRFGVDPNAIDLVLLSHLHGDHFGGVPFLVLDGQLISKRTRPLVVAGPPGTEERVLAAMEVFFPGSSRVERKFEVRFAELEPERRRSFGSVTVTPYEVRHASGAPPFALRVEVDGRTITYSGDTEWTEALIPAARDADLLIAEAYFYEKKIKYHLDYRTLIEHLEALRPKRLVLTHMSRDMLERAGALPVECAADGQSIEL